MRRKMKYLGIVAVAVVAVLAIVLVSCGGGNVAADTADWLANAEKATVTDTVSLSNLNVSISGGLLKDSPILKIGGVDILSTRVIDGDKLNLTLEIKNFQKVEFAALIKTAIGLVVSGIDLDGLNNIGSIKLILKYDPAADNILVGEFHGYGLNALISTLPSGDSNPENEQFFVKKDAVTGENHKRESALISSIIDLLDNPIYGPAEFEKDGKGTSNLSNITAIAQKALELYGADKIYNGNTPTEYDANKLVNMIFGSGKADDIASVINEVLKIGSLKMDVKNATTQKANGKTVYKSTTLTANIDANVGNNYIGNISKNVTNILGAFGVSLPGGIDLKGMLSGELTLEGNVTVKSDYAVG